VSTTIDSALYTVLSAYSGLTSLLGAGDAMRCYPVEAPANARLPLLCYQVIATNPATTHQEGQGDTRLDGTLVQLTALASSQIGAAAVLYQARLALEASTTLKAVLTDERMLPRSDDANCHGRSADIQMWNYPDA
jgi:hypothetical protein